MPIQRDTPRPHTKRRLLYSLEIAQLHQLDEELIKGMLFKAWMDSRKERWAALMNIPGMASLVAKMMQRKRFQRELMGVWSVLEMNNAIRNLPYQRSLSHGPLKSPDDFTGPQFVEQFRFRKAHFYRLLSCLRDEHGRKMMEEGTVRHLKLGEHGHRHTVRADSALMVWLRRMTYPSRWCDLQFIMGSARTTLSLIFTCMTSILYDRYAIMMHDIRPWKGYFRRFASQLTLWGCVHDNLVCFFDGHFQGTCRPGGDANRSLTLWDFQTFSGKEHMHGLKFQAGVMPNGIAVCWGPWRGTQHDATMFAKTGVLEQLEEVSGELGEDFAGFGDSAYSLNRFMARILKPLPEQSLTRLERRYNALMARFRIVIEQLFAQADGYWGLLRHPANHRLGSQAVGKLFPLGMLFLNVHTLFYGNQTANYFETERMLLEVDVEEYFRVADALLGIVDEK